MRAMVNRLARPVAARTPISTRKAACSLSESGAWIRAIRGAMLSTSLRGVMSLSRGLLLYGGGGERRQRRLVAKKRADPPTTALLPSRRAGCIRSPRGALGGSMAGSPQIWALGPTDDEPAP